MEGWSFEDYVGGKTCNLAVGSSVESQVWFVEHKSGIVYLARKASKV
jgi:hypothetical protein